MSSASYWLDTAPPFAGTAEGYATGRFDVAIVGAGLTGLSAALELARCGATVVVLEAGYVLGQASGRNGGQCNVGVHQDYASLCAEVGAGKARAFYRFFAEAVDAVEDLVHREKIDCDFRRSGKLKLAAKPGHFEQLTASHDLLANGVDDQVEIISRDRLRDEIQSDAFFGGLLQRSSAQVHVGKLGIGLANAAARAGVVIQQSTAVKDLQSEQGSGYRLSTSGGDIRAAEVLLATGGAPRGESFSWFRRRIFSVGSFVIVTAPLSEGFIENLLPNRRGYVTTQNIGHHFRSTSDRRLLFGGRARFAMSGSSSDAKSGRLLLRSLTNLFPSLSDVAVDYCWGGQIDMTRDRLPRAGRTRDGVWYSMGYSGHGVQMSIHMGEVIAKRLRGEEVHNPWEHLDWPSIPGHFGLPWFLPVVGAYYRAIDFLR